MGRGREGRELICRGSFTNIFQGQLNVCMFQSQRIVPRFVCFFPFLKAFRRTHVSTPNQTLSRISEMMSSKYNKPDSFQGLTVFMLRSGPPGAKLTFTPCKMPSCLFPLHAVSCAFGSDEAGAQDHLQVFFGGGGRMVKCRQASAAIL